MDINKLQEHILTLPEDNDYRIKVQAEIDRVFDSLIKGRMTRVILSEEDMLDGMGRGNFVYSRLYVSVYHHTEINIEYLGCCSHDKRDVEYRSKRWAEKQHSYGSSAEFDIHEVQIEEPMGKALAEAWKNNIKPFVYFKVKYADKDDTGRTPEIIAVEHSVMGINGDDGICLNSYSADNDILDCEYFCE